MPASCPLTHSLNEPVHSTRDAPNSYPSQESLADRDKTETEEVQQLIGKSQQKPICKQVRTWIPTKHELERPTEDHRHVRWDPSSIQTHTIPSQNGAAASPRQNTIAHAAPPHPSSPVDPTSPKQGIDDSHGYPDPVIQGATPRVIRATTTTTPAIWPKDLIQKVSAAANLPSPTLTPSPFAFELSLEAAHKNFCILRQYGSIGNAIEQNPNSPIAQGSEFRTSSQLEPILCLHPNWPEFKRLIEEGSDWPVSDISDEDRKADVRAALTFGNHKGATSNYQLLRTLVADDVTHGYSLPLPLDKIHLLPGILLAPMNIVEQDTIDKCGNTIPKYRLTHDQSFTFEQGSNTSLNSRLRQDKLHPCYFGWVTRRLINWIVAARRKYPNRRILATKVDFKSAYRRLHLHHRIAQQSCTQLPEDRIALMALRLTFGGAACPFEWSIISETICDLATAIAHDASWDPTTLVAPDQHLVPPPAFLPDDIPFAPGKELIVDVEVDERGTHEMYLDDLIGLTIDLPDTDNRLRAERAPLLAIHTCARPLLIQEPTPREAMAAKNKLTAEAGLTKTKTILGWRWDLRGLIISLPFNKYTSWSGELLTMIGEGVVSTTHLETTIGRLGHLALVIPFVHHFLSRLRELHTRAARSKRRSTRIPPNCISDLKLMEFFLQKAHNGVDMNQIAFRRPTHVYRSDSCPAGLGGYGHTGFAWRYYLPDDLLFRASNNLLEHIAAIITPWIDILNGRLEKGDCALSMTDSTTSEGWLRKTNFLEEVDLVQASVRIQVAREHAMRYMNHEIRDYSQWFPGIENNVADALSREMDLSDDELTTFLRLSFPTQIPENFEIVPLPSEITSWLTSLLRQMPVNELFREEHTRTTLGRGIDGISTASQQDSNMIPSSHPCLANRKSNSSERLPSPSATPDLRETLQLPWLSHQSKVPSVTWSRPFGARDIRTPQETARVF
jgi:hypothetical protein